MSQNIIPHHLFNKKNNEIHFSTETLEKINKIISKYPQNTSK